MIEEKAELFLISRGESPNVGKHMVARFIERNPEYRTKFPRQLEQDRYMNSSIEVFTKWFKKAWSNTWSEPAYGVSENGWTDQDHGVSWLKKIFDPQTKNLDERHLLFVDDHNPHLSAEFITACWERDIIPLCLPPHTTHFLQSSEVVCLGPLDKAYKRELKKKERLKNCRN